jgi:hypothetical protein
MELVIGKTYSYFEVVAKLGGYVPPYYMPHRNNEVVCAFYRPELNPRFPQEVLVEDSEPIKQWATKWCHQSIPVPVFVHGEDEKWYYRGAFKVLRHSTKAAEIQERCAEAKRNGVYQILFLEQVQ